MRSVPRSPARGRPWLDRVAGYISDPVVRLRFLKALAPPSQALSGNGWRRPKRLGPLTLVALLAALALAVVVASILSSRLRASAPIRNAPAAGEGAQTAPLREAATVRERGSWAATARILPAADVWLVEKKGEADTYSNGLRIDNHFLAATHRRRYLAFPADGSQPVERSEPAGIVFHTTESRQAPFEAKQNGILKRLGESLLEYVHRKQAYNFLIDRFGRVYRVVAEDQAANHSGYSAWADESWFYLNLNESFLGISFEAASLPVQPDAQTSAAQVRSAAMLIEMLRSRYRIPASNCVTHAQVSVNPANMRVGLHVDWVSGFPFEELGLPDNYAAALPSMWAYGFDRDASIPAGARVEAGALRAAEILVRNAGNAGLQPIEYKRRLRQRYREELAQVHRVRPDAGGTQ